MMTEHIYLLHLLGNFERTTLADLLWRPQSAMTPQVSLVGVHSSCRYIVVLCDCFDRIIECQLDFDVFSFALGDAARHFLQIEPYHEVHINLDQAPDAKQGKTRLELMVGVDLKNNVDFAQSFDFNCKL
jgi:hypothetical protein